MTSPSSFGTPATSAVTIVTVFSVGSAAAEATDFIDAAHISIALKAGVMTLTAD
jgi:hypothetical protein